jgi:hypothetical protein
MRTPGVCAFQRSLVFLTFESRFGYRSPRYRASGSRTFNARARVKQRRDRPPYRSPAAQSISGTLGSMAGVWEVPFVVLIFFLDMHEACCIIKIKRLGMTTLIAVPIEC